MLPERRVRLVLFMDLGLNPCEYYLQVWDGPEIMKEEHNKVPAFMDPREAASYCHHRAAKMLIKLGWWK